MAEPGGTDGESLPEAAETWLAAHVAGYHGPGRLHKFGFGQSNPTFRLEAASGTYVLRRKPFGPLLPKAHAIEREFDVLKALHGSDVPVPHVRAFCADNAVLGAAFYVMDFVPGRILYDQCMPDLSPGERAAIFDSMNEAVARLHRLDPAAVGLGGFGRGEGFLGRQVSLWTRAYRATEDRPIAAMDELIAWLPAHLPPETPVRIFHGDLRLDNMIMHPTEPRVIALIDWELATLGDALADFAYHAIAWRIPPELFRGLQGLAGTNGFPSEQAYIQHYCARTGRDCIPHWNFYLAFSLFRLAAILQGVWRRARDGQASSIDGLAVGLKAAPLAEIGWRIATGPST